jgi:nitroreductase/NAD-dependent dihydropyrimidine dehydrogenase PreA subunit
MKIDLMTPYHPQYVGQKTIDENKCIGCGQCVKVCPCRVLELQNKKADQITVYTETTLGSNALDLHKKKVCIVKPFWCVHCGHCGSVCPTGAIDESGSELRKITAEELKKTPSSESLQFLFRSRRAVRHYTNRPVTKEDIEKILEAGRYTATGTNSSNVNYLVCNDPEQIAELQKLAAPLVFKFFKRLGIILAIPGLGRALGEKLTERMRTIYAPGMPYLEERTNQGEDILFYNAPAFIAVYGETHDETTPFGCSAALYNCSLMAHTMGIGCCINSFIGTVINFNKKVKKMLGIPSYMKVWGAMTLGYPDVKFSRLTTRKPVKVKWMELK